MTELPNDTRMALGEITATQRYLVKTLDGVVHGFGEFRREMKTEQDAINARLSKLEQWHWKIVGMATASGIVLPIVTSLLVAWLTKGTP
jgi:hypothetical protein